MPRRSSSGLSVTSYSASAECIWRKTRVPPLQTTRKSEYLTFNGRLSQGGKHNFVLRGRQRNGLYPPRRRPMIHRIRLMRIERIAERFGSRGTNRAIEAGEAKGAFDRLGFGIHGKDND